MAGLRLRSLASPALFLALAQAACLPASWGAGALLHPSRRALATPRPDGAQDVSFESGGLKLRGWLFRGHGQRRGTLIYLHGSADNRASGLSIADRFLKRGFDVLAYDSRAHGESEGNACTYGYYEKDDLRKALDLLPVRPVVVLGVSLGGAVALQAAAEEPRIAAVVAVATFSDLRTVATERAPFIATRRDIEAAFRLAEQQAGFRADEASPVKAAERIRVPVLLIHGQGDHETFPQHSERVLAALHGEKRLLLVPGAGHNDALRPEVWTEIDTWLDQVLARVKP
jgi:pimeloyl-ACP methyl ester carboxylesterase